MPSTMQILFFFFFFFFFLLIANQNTENQLCSRFKIYFLNLHFKKSPENVVNNYLIGNHSPQGHSLKIIQIVSDVNDICLNFDWIVQFPLISMSCTCIFNPRLSEAFPRFCCKASDSYDFGTGGWYESLLSIHTKKIPLCRKFQVHRSNVLVLGAKANIVRWEPPPLPLTLTGYPIPTLGKGSKNCCKCYNNQKGWSHN